MFYVIQFPTCPATLTFMQQLTMPQPILWIAAFMGIAALIFLTHTNPRVVKLGVALMFCGLGTSLIPVVNLLTSPGLYCGHAGKLQNLETVFPILNVMTIGLILYYFFSMLVNLYKMVKPAAIKETVAK